MITSLADFFSGSNGCVDTFESFIQKHNLTGKVAVDHICYKCDSKESFERIRTLFETESDFVYQSIISKRRIAYIKFKKGIDTTVGKIDYLELSDQKPDNSQKEGFDHVEIVPTFESVAELATRLEKRGEKVEKVVRPHHTTYDIPLNEFEIKLSTEPLITKIKREEMC